MPFADLPAKATLKETKVADQFNNLSKIIHIMKKVLSLLVLLFPLMLNAAPTTKKVKLEGVWQQVQPATETTPEMKLPVWKVMQNDGTFCTFLIANKKAQCVITNEGTFRFTSDSTFVEHINGTIVNPGLIGKNNKITIVAAEKDRIQITYRLLPDGGEAKETWIRVKLEIPE